MTPPSEAWIMRPMVEGQPHPVSDMLRYFLASTPDSKISVRQFVESFGEREYAMLSVVFALIAALPIPGVHAVLGLPVFFVSLQRVLGYQKIWLPELIMQQNIDRQALSTLFEKSYPGIEFIERLCKPRHEYLTQGKALWWLALINLFQSLVILMPGYGTNFVPAMSIGIVAIGILMHDGRTVVISAVIGIIYSIILIFIYVAIFGILFHALF